MFERFLPSRCPVDDATCRWVMDRYAWLLERFGRMRVFQPMVLPTPEFFPERFEGHELSLRSVLGKIAQRIGVLPESVTLEVIDDDNAQRELLRQTGLEGGWRSQGAAGTFRDETLGFRNHFIVEIQRSVALDPTAAVATLAHELCHALLLGDHYLEGGEDDMEPLTDLATVFFGYGVFTANASLRERNWQAGSMQGWSIGRQGYLDAATIGFALAVHADMRNEQKPTWLHHVRGDVRAPLKRGMRFLRRQRAEPDL